jgi:hypothetical protein
MIIINSSSVLLLAPAEGTMPACLPACLPA